jgi:hypothetical protein
MTESIHKANNLLNISCSNKNSENENESQVVCNTDLSSRKKININLRINEISLIEPSKLNKKNFIELKATGKVKTMNMQHMKIVGITFDSNYQKPTIEMLVILHNFKTNRYGFFTVGGDEVENADLTLNESRRGYARMIRVSNFNSLIRTMKMDKFKIPYGILLVYDKLNAIKFDSKPVLVNANIERAITEGLIDMVIFRYEINGISSYSFYEKIYEPFKNTKYVLKGYGIMDSLSRCDRSVKDISLNFRPDLFKISKPTPGLENDCEQNTYLLNILTTNILIAEPEVVLNKEKNETYLEEIYEEPQMTCSMSSTESVHISNILKDEELELNDSRINEWESTSYFQDRWIPQINEHQNDLISTDTIQRPDVKSWFQYNLDKDDPKISTYSCRICLKYGPELYKPSQQIPTIAKESGQLVFNRIDSKKRNNENLREHGKSTTYLEVVNLLKKIKRESMPELLLQMQKRKDLEVEGELKVTARMMRTIYVELLADVAFNQHKRFVNLQRMHNVDMGFHHDNRMGTLRMIRCISDTMHRDLVTEVNIPNFPISLMVDTTTDSTNNHLMITYLYFLRNNNPIVQFYRLIKIGFSENSESLYNLLIDAFKNDKMEGFLRRNLITFITDGYLTLNLKFF